MLLNNNQTKLEYVMGTFTAHILKEILIHNKQMNPKQLYVSVYNRYTKLLKFYSLITSLSPGAVKYIDCTSAEG